MKNCTLVQKEEVFTAGDYDNSVGKGTKSHCFSFLKTCGVEIFVDTKSVVDFLSFEFNGIKSGQIGVGEKGFFPLVDLEIGIFDTLPLIFTKTKGYKGPIDVYVSEKGFVISKSKVGSVGFVTFFVNLDFFKLEISSNLTAQTNWDILCKPKNFCKEDKDTVYQYFCTTDTVVLKNSCENTDLWNFWKDSLGNIISFEDSLILYPPIKASSYFWEKPCNTGKIVLVENKDAEIIKVPYLCSSKVKLSLPEGEIGLWSTKEFSNSIVVQKAGKYSVKFGNCNTSLDVFISNKDLEFHDFDLDVSVVPDKDTIFLGEKIQTYSNSSNTVFNWFDGNDFQILNPDNPGIYYLSGSLDNCFEWDTLVLFGFLDKCDFPIFKPNVFSPNGDGINETFKIFGPYPTDFLMKVFDRWGKEIFVSRFLNDSWDGTYKGEELEKLAVLVYFAEVFHDFKKCFVKGDVLLMR